MSRTRALAAAAVLAVTAGTGLLTSTPASAGLPDDLLANSGNTLIAFNSTAPAGTANEVPVLVPDEVNVLRGIDVRPSTQVVYGLFDMVDGSLTVGTINHVTGAVGTLVTLTLSGSTFLASESFTAIDFNPVVDRLRLLSANGDDSIAVNVDTGEVTVNPDLNGLPDAENPYHAFGAAYTNSTPGPAPASTVLFDVLDLSLNEGGVDSLVTQVPSTGVVSLVGPLGRNLNGDLGFEITASGAGFIAGTERQEVQANSAGNIRTKAGVPEVTSLYSVDLATGATTTVDTIGDGTSRVNGLTSFPVQVPATTTTTLATSTTAAVSPTSAVSPTTRVLARTGDEENRQGAVGLALIAAGGVALVAAARLRSRRA